MKKFLIMTIILTSMVAATSCNVTRTITNESQYYQRGDTSVVIQTKTIETYDASKRSTKADIIRLQVTNIYLLTLKNL